MSRNRIWETRRGSWRTKYCPIQYHSGGKDKNSGRGTFISTPLGDGAADRRPLGIRELGDC